LEQAQRIELRFKVTPATEGVEDELAILRGPRRFFCSFGRLDGANRFQSGSVCHRSRSANYHCAIGGEGLRRGGKELNFECSGMLTRTAMERSGDRGKRVPGPYELAGTTEGRGCWLCGRRLR